MTPDNVNDFAWIYVEKKDLSMGPRGRHTTKMKYAEIVVWKDIRSVLPHW